METLIVTKTKSQTVSNCFFTIAVTHMKQTLRIVNSTNRQQTRHEMNRSHPSFKFEKVSKTFVLKTIKKLKTGKASGLDNISPRLLKDCWSDCQASYPHNASLSRVAVPHDWRFSKVIPLFKKGVATVMDNYRPISVLSAVSKLLAKSVHHQLYHFLNEQKLLSPFQCGFRKKSLNWDCCYSLLRLCTEGYGLGSTYRGCLYWSTESVWLCRS